MNKFNVSSFLVIFGNVWIVLTYLDWIFTPNTGDALQDLIALGHMLPFLLFALTAYAGAIANDLHAKVA